jgi:outer membrane protein TolC
MKYKPQLSFYANAGLSAAYLPAVDRLGFSTGLTFSWILYDGHQREIQKERSQIRINSVEIEKNYFKRQQAIQKNKISNQIFALEERKRLIEKNIKQYNKLIESYQNEIAYGQISIIDLKNLFQELTNKKQDALLIEMERQSLISAYNYWYY